ncbi:MAG: Gfo/Idh/MocA family oxidoreductase [Bryobacterales bacterium]|nr:Gfo/Idh/MocA family oxidoreductase [Bryobacterales bacterium]
MAIVDRRTLLMSLSGSIVSRPTWAGANDRVRVALVGAGDRGRELLDSALRAQNVEIATICDPDENRMREKAAEVEKRTGASPALEPDIRKVIEQRDIDAVVLACCNHWHALGTVWAVQAGKHVYVEKPVSHDPVEGRRMVEAARKYNRAVQGGTQRRSSPRFQRAMGILHSGGIGDIYMARWLFTGPRDSIGFHLPENPPASLHWDLWLGPASKQPFHRNLAHYNWHWFWEFGNGEMGNNGVHSMDVMLWGLGKGIPSKVRSSGGRFGYKDQAETPNTQIATFEYEDRTQILCEVRGLYSNEPTGMHFYGSKGAMHLGPQGQCRIFMGRNEKPEPELPHLDEIQERAHFDNFIAAVRTGRRETLNCDIEIAEQSALMSHLANISYRLGRELHFDPVLRRFSDKEANLLMTRQYRKPYAMPEKV